MDGPREHELPRDIGMRPYADQRPGGEVDELACATPLQSVGEITASIAHEVSQPLAAIIANGHACVRWLTRATPNIPEACESATRIIRDAVHANAVIARIREFAARSAPARDEVALNAVVRAALTSLEDEMTRDGVVLELELAPDLPLVRGDGVQLQQVIRDLVMNAIDSMREIHERPRELAVTTRSHPHGAEVLVRDCGCGVRAQNLPRICDPFFTTKPRGMGLGLSISRRIIDAHRGQLTVCPNENHGITAAFLIPIGSGDSS